ncbi:hypothetical protein HBA54_04320 [Pelagibius litoralis]|uniref:Uncharacterized protein n=1 Tax=Pelagibius litoralis TaxID=374515 RepID=A0A967C249_9PROT|nr:hypothetical protein [Pelagibius litoralis]NIA67808.1 hypothetical protein [Pelagibius litoralis]
MINIAFTRGELLQVLTGLDESISRQRNDHCAAVAYASRNPQYGQGLVQQSESLLNGYVTLRDRLNDYLAEAAA